MVDKALRASLRRKTGIVQTRDRVRHVDDADKVGRVREASRDWLLVDVGRRSYAAVDRA